MSRHHTLYALCTLGLFGCTGDLQNSSPDDMASDMSAVASPDAGSLPGDMPERMLDQGQMPSLDLSSPDLSSPDLSSPIEPASPMLALGPDALRRSEDRGQSWSALPLPEGLDLIHGAIWADQTFWLFGEGTRPLWQSPDGASWEPVEVPAEITGITALAHGEQGNFMGVHAQSIIHSAEGKSWTHVPESVPEDETLLDITWFKGQFVAVGDSITALSDDGQTWSERRGWETPMTRIISHGDYVVRVRETNVQISLDAREWRSDYTFCRDTQEPPSAPVLSPEGAMLSKCSGILKASGSKFSWRQVGKGTQMPTPMLHAHGLFHGVDEQGEFVWSETGLEWTRATGDAGGITRMVSATTPTPAPAPPEQPECPHGALACIDFEQEITGLPPVFGYGLRAGKANVVAIDSEFAFSGNKSMRVDAFADQEGQGGMIALEKEDFPTTLKDKIYGSMMFYTTAYPVRNWHMSESAGVLANADNKRVQYNAGGDHGRAFHNYYGNGSDCWNRSEVDYPVDQWFCWQVEYDRAANTMIISIDGQEAHRMDGMGDGCIGGQGAQTVWQAPAAFEFFNIGYRPFKKQEQDMTTWIDDVVISDKPIPCPER